jgi:hypothetical protein
VLKAFYLAIAAGLFSSIGAPLLLGQPAMAASASRFVCGTSGGAPATQALTKNGKTVTVIRWTSSVFDGAGWSQQRRCQEVSSRFEDFRRSGQLKYLTTGRINGQPVICTSPSKGGACDGLLYTLKPGQDPTATLRTLLDIRVKARGPLNETNPRLYVSMDEILDVAQVNAGSAAPSNTDHKASGSSSSGLW